MTRDFSEKAKQKLEGYADDAAASSTWGKIKVRFSDRGMDFRSWAGNLLSETDAAGKEGNLNGKCDE